MPSGNPNQRKPRSNSAPQHMLPQFEDLLELLTARLDPVLLDSAFSQIAAGLIDRELVHPAANVSERYAIFLQRSCALVSEAMSPEQMAHRIHQVGLTALAAGWMSAVAAMQCRLLHMLVSPNPGCQSPSDSGNDATGGRL